ncbi:hypothetical protein Tco_0213639 [Tanacetum coccineum]
MMLTSSSNGLESSLEFPLERSGVRTRGMTRGHTWHDMWAKTRPDPPMTSRLTGDQTPLTGGPAVDDRRCQLYEVQTAARGDDWHTRYEVGSTRFLEGHMACSHWWIQLSKAGVRGTLYDNAFGTK